MSHDLERPGEDDDLVIRGDIETTSVPELLRSILGSGETGVLTIRNGDAVKSIFILNGRVAYASSNNPDERMGEVLLVARQDHRAQFVEASKRIRPGLRLGSILVELGALEPEELIPPSSCTSRASSWTCSPGCAGNTSSSSRTSTPATTSPCSTCRRRT